MPKLTEKFSQMLQNFPKANKAELNEHFYYKSSFHLLSINVPVKAETNIMCAQKYKSSKPSFKNIWPGVLSEGIVYIS